MLSIVFSTVVIGWIIRDPAISLTDIGINPTNFMSGLLYGALALVIISLVIGAASLVPFMKNSLKDERSKGLSTKQLAYKTLVNIPIGTVLLEEVIFRGVMLALLTTNFSTPLAVLISSFLFGLWHILPAITNVTTNSALKKTKKPNITVSFGTVFVTFLAGIAFSWLRLASGSLLAPMIAHYATNSGGTIASWISHKFD